MPKITSTYVDKHDPFILDRDEDTEEFAIDLAAFEYGEIRFVDFATGHTFAL